MQFNRLLEFSCYVPFFVPRLAFTQDDKLLVPVIAD
jgi:hypothetical protein